MSKGTQTRERILEQAAALFNQRGFAGASMADLMAATGLKKGGIYRHFETKEALAVEAFDYAVERVAVTFVTAVKGHRDAVDRLHAILDLFGSRHSCPEIPGGCPVMNTAIEADDGNPVLREHARDAMDRLRAFLRRIVAKGQARGQVRPELDADEVASILLSSLEGALMLSGLYRDGVHLERVRRHLASYLEAEVRLG